MHISGVPRIFIWTGINFKVQLQSVRRMTILGEGYKALYTPFGTPLTADPDAASMSESWRRRILLWLGIPTSSQWAFSALCFS